MEELGDLKLSPQNICSPQHNNMWV